jgi:hypothetical protein
LKRRNVRATSMLELVLVDADVDEAEDVADEDGS